MLGENTNISTKLTLDNLKSLKPYGESLQTISKYSADGTLNLNNLKTTIAGLSQTQMAHIAVQNKSLLLTKNIGEAELIEKLRKIGLTEAQAAQTAQEILNTQAKTANTAASKFKTQAQLTETLTQVGLTKTQATNTAAEIASIQAKAAKTGVTQALVTTEIEELLVTKGLTIEKAKNTAVTIASATAQKSLLATVQATTVGLRAQATAWLLTPMGIITTIAVGVWGIVTAVNYASKAYERQTQKVKDLADSYKSLQSEIDTVNSELKTTIERMQELSSKDALSFVENEELLKLQAVSEELRIQLALLEKQEEITAKKVANESLKLYEKGYGKTLTSKESIVEYYESASTSGNVAILGSNQKDISAMIAYYKQLITLKEQATTGDDIAHYSNLITDTEESLVSSSKELQGMYDNLSALKNPTADQQKALDEIGNSLKFINAQIVPEQVIGNVFSKEEFASIREELENLASEGKLSESTLASYTELNGELENVKLSASQVVDYFNAIAEAKQKYASTGDGLVSEKAPTTFDKLTKSINDFTFAQTESEQAFRKSQIEDILKDLHKEAEKGDITWGEYDDAAKAVEVTLGGLGAQIDKLNNQLDSVQSLVGAVINGISEYNEKGLNYRPSNVNP